MINEDGECADCNKPVSKCGCDFRKNKTVKWIEQVLLPELESNLKIEEKLIDNARKENNTISVVAHEYGRWTIENTKQFILSHQDEWR